MANPSDPTTVGPEQLVRELVCTSLFLGDLVADLIESCPEDAFPGEEPAEVLLEMLTGTVRPVVASTDPAVREAVAELLEAMRTKTLNDLRGALAIKRARARGSHHG